jgi:hypothetical protein
MAVTTTLGLGASPGAAQPAPLEQQLAEVRAATQKAQLLATTYQLDSSGLHDLDVALNERGQLVSGALGKIRRARIATQATAWPRELEETANKLVAQLVLLEQGLRDESVEAAKGPAKEVHDIAHDLSGLTYDLLSGQKPAGHGH